MSDPETMGRQSAKARYAASTPEARSPNNAVLLREYVRMRREMHDQGPTISDLLENIASEIEQLRAENIALRLAGNRLCCEVEMGTQGEAVRKHISEWERAAA